MWVRRLPHRVDRLYSRFNRVLSCDRQTDRRNCHCFTHCAAVLCWRAINSGWMCLTFLWWFAPVVLEQTTKCLIHNMVRNGMTPGISTAYTVSQKRPTFDLLQSWHTRSDSDNFWQKCYWESKETDDALFSHLTYLVIQHYFAKEETQKTAHWCFVHASQSNCWGAVDFLSPVPWPKSSK